MSMRPEYRVFNEAGAIDPVERFQELQGNREVWSIRGLERRAATIYSIGIEGQEDLDRVLQVLADVNSGRGIPQCLNHRFDERYPAESNAEIDNLGAKSKRLQTLALARSFQNLFDLSLSFVTVFLHWEPNSWPQDGSLCLFALVDPSDLDDPLSLSEMFIGRFMGHFDLEGDEQACPVILDADFEQRFGSEDEIPEDRVLVYSVIRFNRKQED